MNQFYKVYSIKSNEGVSSNAARSSTLGRVMTHANSKFSLYSNLQDSNWYRKIFVKAEDGDTREFP
jgi:hypothetical protein